MTMNVPLLHTQLGFRPGQTRKHIVAPDVPEARTIFGDPIVTVFEQNEFSKHALNSPEQPQYTHRDVLRRTDSDFGPWLVGDIGSIRTNGVYQTTLGSNLSPTFVIRDDVYLRVLPMCIRYFQIQSCGRDVPGWHEACHLDDGYIVEEDRYIEAAGGWHDAGDFRKWASSTSMIAISLLIANRLYGGREESLGLAPGIFLQEAMQGFDYFLNIQQPDGSLLHNIGGGKDSFHDNGDCRYTDNIPESGDERRIHPGPAKPPAKYAALYALYAEELWNPAPEEAQEAVQAAEKALEYDRSTDDLSLENLQWRAWAHLILHRIAGGDEHKNAAMESIARVLDMQVTDYIGGQQTTRGFWRKSPESNQYHHKHVGNTYHIWILAEFIETFPEHADVKRWTDAITLWIDDYALVFADRNPFGLLPYALYETPPQDNAGYTYRSLGDKLCFRYFMANKGRISNARCSAAALAFAAAARVLSRPELLDRGYRLLEWTLGANPFQISTMNGIGVAQPDPLSFQMGCIPGGVTLGPGGNREDMPFYMHPRSCTDEYYGYQTSQFLWATLALQNQSWQ
ncbi:MAG: glycoside hydrolase family 9 protein [Verrucomicrobiota bacterium]